MPDECKGNAVPFQSPAEIESLLRWLHAEAAFERDTIAANFEAALADKDRVIQRMAVWRDRWMDAWHATHAEWWKSQGEIDRLRREVEFWGNADPLTDGHAGSRDNLRYPLCACISDDQADSLGPGFSRPVCAVHPTPSDLQVPPSLGAWRTHPRTGVMHVLMPGADIGECGWATVPLDDWRPAADGNARCLPCMELAPRELIDPTWQAVGGDPLSGTPWAEGGEPS